MRKGSVDVLDIVERASARMANQLAMDPDVLHQGEGAHATQCMDHELSNSVPFWSRGFLAPCVAAMPWQCSTTCFYSASVLVLMVSLLIVQSSSVPCVSS